jgi:hypothetical protein
MMGRMRSTAPKFAIKKPAGTYGKSQRAGTANPETPG